MPSGRNRPAFLVTEYVAKMSKMGVDGKKIIEDFERLYKKYEKK